jgi:hypothetical protein
MTNPGDSDEWWKQYGGEGVSSESGGQPSAPPPPSPSAYPSSPQYPAQPMPPQPQSYPSYPQPPAQPYPAGPAYQPYGGYPQPRSTNGLAIASLVTSLSGLACGITAIAGIILGVMALNQLKVRNQDGRGMALAGIWIGAVILVLIVAYFVVVGILIANTPTDS